MLSRGAQMNEAPAWSLAARMDATTTSAVRGSPSWNVTSGRIWNVQVMPSALLSQLVASAGVKGSSDPGGLIHSNGS